MELIINITYLFIISILPLLLGEEHPYPRCEWEKKEDCVTRVSVYNIGNKSFEVFQLSPENVKNNILYCDWIENEFKCVCSIFKCSPPDNDTFHAFISSTGKCLNVTNLQFSYGWINGIQCTPNEYSNLSTNGIAGNEDRANSIPNGESSTSPTTEVKGHEASSPAQSDTTKVWLPVVVTVAVVIVVAAIVAFLWIYLKKRRKDKNKPLQQNPKTYDMIPSNDKNYNYL